MEEDIETIRFVNRNTSMRRKEGDTMEIIGLHDDARDFLLKFCKRNPEITCPKCGHIIKENLCFRSYEDERLGEGGPTLSIYKLKTGEEVKEVMQKIVKGNLFSCLMVNDMPCFLWSDREIKENITCR